jgi:arsenite methyltransferase
VQTTPSSFAPDESNLNSMRKYARKAKLYDGTSHRTDWIRQHTINLLELKPGQVVLDVGCGSGLSLAILQGLVGDRGLVVGIEQSREMLDLAQAKIAQKAWRNVRVDHGFCEACNFPEKFDAFLFNYTHDIMQSPQALRNLLSYAKPGARVAIAGVKFFPRWMEPLNLYAYFKNFAWNGNGSGLRRPWRHIEKEINFRWVRSTQLGMGYIACGTVKNKASEV